MGSAFYCVSSGEYFLGAVALVNSLRLHGHAEPIYLLDAGLEPAQRELLAAEVTLVDPPGAPGGPGAPDGPGAPPPHLLKTIAPLRHPAEVMVLIDADMIATRSLGGLVEEAASVRSGKVVAFANDVDRFVPEWGELLELGPVTRRRYVSSGFVALGGAVGSEVLQLWDDRQRRAPFDLSIDIRRRDAPDHPLLYLDQDVLNAVLCTRIDPDALEVLDHRLAPHQPFRGLELADERTLRCGYADGTRPFVVHQFIRKPWLEPTYHGLYSRLLARLLIGDDVAIRVPRDWVPLRMRDGLLAKVERKRVDVQDLVRWYARDVVPDRLRARARTPRRHPEDA